jgi:hypothetical protein
VAFALSVSASKARLVAAGLYWTTVTRQGHFVGCSAANVTRLWEPWATLELRSSGLWITLPSRPSVHRAFYPNARPGQDPKSLRPIARAAPVVDTQGVRIDFLVPRRSFTPDELKMLGRWLFALGHETDELGKAGLISSSQSYDVSASKVVPRPADT